MNQATPRLLLIVAMLSACANQRTTTLTPVNTSAATRASATITAAAIHSTVTPTAVLQQNAWEDLLRATPIPHEFSLPEPVASALDGTYAKVDQSPPQWWTCYRCADYRPMGGIWRLQFDKGAMRIFYEVTNWKSIASFTVNGNRVRIFNDPFCPHVVGEYVWKIEGGQLNLNAIDDSCAFDLRKGNLTKQAWSSCTKGQQSAEGCIDPPDTPEGATPADLPVRVTVYDGDSHYFKKPPEVYAAANKDDTPSPEGIEIQFADESIEFGTNRILWWKGDWIEAKTELPLTSIGVQFWGSGYLGWARVLFDGTEVWRGRTTSLGKHLAYYGGYVEVTGFEPGKHTIRVENLGFDYHPIKVWAFGFSKEPAQK